MTLTYTNFETTYTATVTSDAKITTQNEKYKSNLFLFFKLLKQLILLFASQVFGFYFSLIKQTVKTAHTCNVIKAFCTVPLFLLKHVTNRL